MEMLDGEFLSVVESCDIIKDILESGNKDVLGDHGRSAG